MTMELAAAEVNCHGLTFAVQAEDLPPPPAVVDALPGDTRRRCSAVSCINRSTSQSVRSNQIKAISSNQSTKRLKECVAVYEKLISEPRSVT